MPLDVSSDYRCLGNILFSEEDFFADSSAHPRFIGVPRPSLEFAYYCAKKIIKTSLKEEQALRLSELFAADPEGCSRRLSKLFPPSEASLVRTAAESGDWAPVKDRLPNLRRALLLRRALRNPLSACRFWLEELPRLFRRLTQPTGLWISLLGPDGCGKSSVLARLEQDLAPLFRHTKRYHVRPFFLHGNSPVDAVDRPQEQATRSSFSSLLKLGLWWADFTFGYLFALFPALLRSTLLLFDRGYADLLVDPKRYRYGAPLALARFLGFLLPRPNLTLVLDVPAEILQSRKQEVPFAESARQRQAYLDLAKNTNNGFVIDASRPLDEVVREAENIVIRYLEKRTEKRWKRHFDD
ncbi:MAG TPA: thymidylate kinase-like protein [Cyanobacteria bacterium UBA8530]|nr:thymidylate kinase-like protein [Cyanobacteria bacterium UBA8530]